MNDRELVAASLKEDIGPGDLTTAATIPVGTKARAEMVAKEDFVLAGMEVAQEVFRQIAGEVAFECLTRDGEKVRKGEVIAWLKGDARSLLQGERTALNLLQRLSGVATLTADYVAAVAGTGVRIVDTRKTTPGLRALEKYAVSVGGGFNHRHSLFDGILIKENHIAAAGGIAEAVERARAHASHLMKVEIEVQSLTDVQVAVDAGAEVLLLDNMTLEQLRDSVEMVAGRALCEASGGVTLDSVRAIAETGVDLISVGALTHSYRAVDISMLFQL